MVAVVFKKAYSPAMGYSSWHYVPETHAHILDFMDDETGYITRQDAEDAAMRDGATHYVDDTGHHPLGGNHVDM